MKEEFLFYFFLLGGMKILGYVVLAGDHFTLKATFEIGAIRRDGQTTMD